MKVKLKKSLALLLALLMTLSTMTTLAMADDETPDPATCEHEWDLDWDWNEDYSACLVTRTCLICHMEEGPVEAEDVTSTVTQAATCTEPGSRTVRARVVFDDTDTYVEDGIEVEIPASGHVWSDAVTFTWSDDYSSATASRVCVCEDCGQDCQCEPWTIDAEVRFEETTVPTCTENGVMTYTATADFGDGVIGTDTQMSEIDATGHTWGDEITWTWLPEEITAWTDPDTVTATATRYCVCEDCGLEDCTCDPDTVDADVTYLPTEPTCEDDGYMTYTATAVIDGVEKSDTLVVTYEGTATGHEYGEPEFTWTEDYSHCTATRVCVKCGDEEEKDANITKETKDATCTTDGETVYTATVVFDGNTYTDTITVKIVATGHTWGDDITWTWTPAEITAETDPEDVSATATRTCTKCNEQEPIDAEVTHATAEATCTTDGEIVYTATATFDEDTDYAKTVTGTLTVVLPALGHDWDEPEWTWADDYSSAEATFTCKRCETTETVVDEDVTFEETTAPTCTTEGEMTYTATVVFDGETYNDTMTSAIAALGHDFATIEWNWASDYGAASVTFTCSRCGMEDTEIADVTPVITEPTCTEDGYTTYYAIAEVTVDGKPYIFKAEKVGNETEALGHDWADPEWTWDPEKNDINANTDPDEVTAEASRTCQRDGCGEIETEIATVTYEGDYTAPTCTTDGSITYTATVTFEGETEPDTDTVGPIVLPALGHEWGTTEWTWNPNPITADTDPEIVTATATRICTVCGEPETKTADVTYENDYTAPTCTTDGSITYTATVTFDGETDAESTTYGPIVLPALGHEWGTTEWTWNPDPITADTDPEIVTAEASRTCQRDGCETTETEPADVTYANDYVEPKCTTTGSITYTATVTFDGETVPERATYGPIVLPATGHEWSKVTDDSWVWSADYSTAEVYRECLKCGAVEINDADVTEEDIEPTCTVDGGTVFTGTVTIDGVIYTNEQKPESMIVPATGHTWGSEITWTWNPDKDDITYDTDPADVTVTATRMCECSNCGDECDCELYYADVTVTTVVTNPTCMEDGYITYSAEAVFDDGVSDSQDVVVVNEGSATGHIWSEEITWTWLPDDITYETDPTTVTATATRECICKNCGADCDCGLYYADVTVDYDIVDPTCEEDGYIIYTAEAEFDDGVTDSCEPLVVVDEGSATGHTYGAVQWIWEPDDITYETDPETVSATAFRECKDCHYKDYADDVTVSWDTTEATCETAGEILYTAEAYFNGLPHYGYLEVEIPALGHDWGKVIWSEVEYDGSEYTITASRTCQRAGCGAVESSGTLTVTRTEVPATCTEDGEIIYTAEWVYDENSGEPVEGGPFEYTEYDFVKAEHALGHDWNVSFDWDDFDLETDNGTVTASRVCTRCGDEDPDNPYTAVVTKDDTSIEPTCTDGGHYDYTATVNIDGVDYTDTRSCDVDATGHIWSDITWTWSNDDSMAWATRVCEVCKEYEGALAGVTSVTTDPTCTAAGETVYTATVYLDGVEYTDEKTVEIPATGHTWGEPTWSWSDDNSECTAHWECVTCGEEEDEKAEVSIESTDATCTEAGKTVYVASAELDGTTYTDTKTVESAALGHSWGEPSWIWSSDYSSAYALFVCDRCGRVEASFAVITTNEIQSPTCTDAGQIEYIATVVFNGKTISDTRIADQAALGHTWGDAVFTWSSDNSSATATRTCTACHKDDTVTADVSSTTTAATCEKDGQTVYTATATFSDGTTASETKTVTIDALGHSWGEPAWTWSSDHSTAYATFVCDRCGKIETPVAIITSQTTDPTCTDDGQTEYTATLTFDGKLYTDTETVKIAALGHTWGDAVFTWSSDNSSATASRKCTVCHTDETVPADVSSTTTAATCEKDGQTVYTATATFSDDTTASETKTVTIDALGHSWGEPAWTWSSDHSTAYAAFVCDRCEKIETSVAIITSETTDPTCTVAGQTVYTATVTFDGKLYTNTETAEITAPGHTWGDVEFTWNSDNSATASRTCKVCGTKETVDATVTITDTDATCTEPGRTVYTATATFDGVQYSATKTVEDAALGHSWAEPTWNWSSDHSTAYAAFVCDRCGRVETVLAIVTSETTEPTCTVAGQTVYTATVTFNGKEYTNTETVELAALGHTWGDVEFSWNSDNSATATRTCKTCGAVDSSANVVVTSETTEPTNTQAGQTVYTATATFSDGTVATGTKTVVIPALGEPDTTKLDAEIAAAEALNKEDYTEASWADLQAALAAAEAVLRSDTATQADIDAATEVLSDAIDSLVPVKEEAEANKEALNIAIEAAYALDKSEYTEDSWASLQSALIAAETVCNDSSATQSQVNEALDALLDAITALVKSDTSTGTDKTTLDVVISAAEVLVSSEYTSESWTVVEEALNAAKDVAADPDATQEQVNAAFDALEEAINGLVKVDTGELFTGFKLNEADGNWYYYIDSVIAYDLNSVVYGTVDGIDAWWYVVGGQVQLNFTGLAEYGNEYGWWYIEDGKVNFDHNCVDKNSNGWWYVVGSKVQFGFTGLAEYGNEYGWWYIENGKVNFDHNCVDQNSYGWWYVVGSKVQFDFTGLAEYGNEYGWWYIENGKVNFDHNCVDHNSYGWWYVVGSKVQFNFTGLANYGNEYGWWYIENGKVNFDFNGVEQNNYGWWYIVGSEVQFGYTGVANYSNAYGWWYIKEGKVDFSFTGWATNSYGRWYCVDGKVDFSRS